MALAAPLAELAAASKVADELIPTSAQCSERKFVQINAHGCRALPQRGSNDVRELKLMSEYVRASRPGWTSPEQLA